MTLGGPSSARQRRPRGRSRLDPPRPQPCRRSRVDGPLGHDEPGASRRLRLGDEVMLLSSMRKRWSDCSYQQMRESATALMEAFTTAGLDDNQQRTDSARRDDRFVTRSETPRCAGSPDASWCICTYTWMRALGATTASSKFAPLVLSPISGHASARALTSALLGPPSQSSRCLWRRTSGARPAERTRSPTTASRRTPAGSTITRDSRNWRRAGRCELGPTHLLRRRRDSQLGASRDDRDRSVAGVCRGSKLHSQASAICGSSSEPSGARTAARRSMRQSRALRMRRLLRIEGVASLAVSVEVGTARSGCSGVSRVSAGYVSMMLNPSSNVSSIDRKAWSGSGSGST